MDGTLGRTIVSTPYAGNLLLEEYAAHALKTGMTHGLNPLRGESAPRGAIRMKIPGPRFECVSTPYAGNLLLEARWKRRS